MTATHTHTHTRLRVRRISSRQAALGDCQCFDLARAVREPQLRARCAVCVWSVSVRRAILYYIHYHAIQSTHNTPAHLLLHSAAVWPSQMRVFVCCSVRRIRYIISLAVLCAWRCRRRCCYVSVCACVRSTRTGATFAVVAVAGTTLRILVL